MLKIFKGILYRPITVFLDIKKQNILLNFTIILSQHSNAYSQMVGNPEKQFHFLYASPILCIVICIKCICASFAQNLFIFYCIICHGTSLEKNNMATWGLEPVSHLSVNRHASHSTIRHPPKIYDGRCVIMHHTYYHIFFTLPRKWIMGCVMVECLACLLTETSDAGSNPHVAKRGFINDIP